MSKPDLSKLQIEALVKLVALAPNTREDAYTLGVSLATLHALQKKGLAHGKHGAGAFSDPRVGIQWRVTALGVTAYKAVNSVAHLNDI